MTTRTAERTEFLGDIITTAVEGGTGYWATVIQYQYVMGGEESACVGRLREGEGARASIIEHIEATGTLGQAAAQRERVAENAAEYARHVTVETVALGIGRIRRGEVGVSPTLRDYILTADADNDAGEIDADCADVIVQAGLFGEVVYG